jgi:hypothetical protein
VITQAKQRRRQADHPRQREQQPDARKDRQRQPGRARSALLAVGQPPGEDRDEDDVVDPEDNFQSKQCE